MSTRPKALQAKPNHTLGRGEDAVFTHVCGLANDNGGQFRAPVRSDEPLGDNSLLFLTIYAFQAFVAEALGIRVSKKSISFPRRLVAGFPFLVLWRVRIKCADIDQISSRPKARVRVQKSTGERWTDEPESRGAAAIFSICQKGGPFDQHMSLTSDRRAPLAAAFPSPAKPRILCGAASPARAGASSRPN